MRAIFRLLALFLLALCLQAAPAGAKGLTCDFYDLEDLPKGWLVSMSPGLNNSDDNSMGHYYNREKNASVLIQVAPTPHASTLDAVAKDITDALRGSGCEIIAGPEKDGELYRVRATMTGTPAVIWIGVNDGFQAMTAISGDLRECALFMSNLRNANPLLIPGADMVRP